MLGKPTLVTRVAVGKAVGLLFGLAAFLTIPYLLPEADPLLRWGFLLWYVTLGAMIGLVGAIARHPEFDIPLPWWIRAPLLAAWMNFLLTLLLFPSLRTFSEALFGRPGWHTSPFWFIAEGAVVGLVIGYATSRAGTSGLVLDD